MKNTNLLKNILLFSCLAPLSSVTVAEQCYHPNSWFNPATSQYSDNDSSISQMISHNLVLLGEHHANEQHHRWHVQLLKQLTSKETSWQIGMEVFPRSKQAILDQWTSGQLDETQFKRLLDWDSTWSFPYQYYRPIFLLARDKRIPLIALNVDRKLVQKTGKLGWKNVPMEEREGVGDPARPTKQYIQRLAISFQRHNTQAIGEKQKQQFARFVQQQLLWDRAMAEAIATAIKTRPNRKMVAIIGSWHLIASEGVPTQLKALDKNDYYIAIPWDDHLDCSEVSKHFANIIYTP